MKMTAQAKFTVLLQGTKYVQGHWWHTNPDSGSDLERSFPPLFRNEDGSFQRMIRAYARSFRGYNKQYWDYIYDEYNRDAGMFKIQAGQEPAGLCAVFLNSFNALHGYSFL